VTHFQRLAPAFAGFFLASVAMAGIFGAIIYANGSPVMPDAYGPIVYALPAWVWVLLQGSFSLVTFVAAAFQRPLTCAIGSGLVMALFLFFAVGATYGEFKEPYLVAMAWPCSAICGTVAWISWRGRDGAR
jgi:hypothetical protein